MVQDLSLPSPLSLLLPPALSPHARVAMTKEPHGMALPEMEKHIGQEGKLGRDGCGGAGSREGMAVKEDEALLRQEGTDGQR